MSMTEGSGATVTVGAALAEALSRAGIKLAFTVPSESLVPLLEGLAAHHVRIVTTRHEGAAAFMAEAAAQLTGRPTLVMAGRAPGAANLAVGLQTAHADSTPVVAVVGQVRRDVRGREAFQEMDVLRAFEPIVKWAAEAREPADVPALGERAVVMAGRGRPGPALLSIPEDLLEASLPADQQRSGPHPDHPAEPDPHLVRKALHLLLDSERPLILAGAGVLRARSTDALVRFADSIHVPVVASWRRGDVFPNDHPLFLGMTGLGAADCVRRRVEEADALLVLGSRLGQTTSYDYSIPVAGSRWAHVDVEPRPTASPAGPAELVMAADVAAFLRVAQRVLSGAVLDAAELERRRARNAADRERFESESVVGNEPWEGAGVQPGRAVAALAATLPPEAIITTDAGDFGTWAARGLRFRRPGTFLGPTSGSMGYGLPAAIAASLARPGRLAVALAGDGGFAMTMSELETAVRERAHVIAVVFDNGRYGTIWRHQVAHGFTPGLATRLGSIDFAAVATACGALGLTVRSDEELVPALRQALEAGRPALLHLAVDPRWTTPDRAPMAEEETVPEEPREVPRRPEEAAEQLALAVEPGESAVEPVEPEPPVGADSPEEADSPAEALPAAGETLEPEPAEAAQLDSGPAETAQEPSQ